EAVGPGWIPVARRKQVSCPSALLATVSDLAHSGSDGCGEVGWEWDDQVVELEAVEREMHSRLGAVVDRYAQRVYPAVLDQEQDEFVCSPLGVWLLLAAC